MKIAITHEQLNGVKVLDLGIWRPAPYATQLLAELGAEVTKVEPPGGDPMLAFPGLYRTLNRRKAIVEIDLKSDEGRLAIAPLLSAADIVIEGFRPGVASRLGVGFTEACAANPSVIYCSLSGFGQDGPLAAVPGHDLNYQAWAGVLAYGPPAGIPLADLAGGTFAAMATCAALARRGLVGREHFRAEYIDVGMADVLASWAAPEIGGDLAGHIEPAAGFPAYGTFDCLDGQITLGIVTEDPFWKVLCQALDLASPDDVAGLADLDARSRALRGPELRSKVAAMIATFRRDPLVRTLTDLGVPAAPVLNRAEAIALEHFRHRQVITEAGVDHPVRFSAFDSRP